jgi:hypothetical protein
MSVGCRVNPTEHRSDLCVRCATPSALALINPTRVRRCKLLRDIALWRNNVSNWTARLICSGLLAFACVNLSGRESFAQLPSPRPERWQLAEMIYDGGLRPGWQDWGWGAHEISAVPARINFSNYGGWILHHDSQEKNYDDLRSECLLRRHTANFCRCRWQMATRPSQL